MANIKMKNLSNTPIYFDFVEKDISLIKDGTTEKIPLLFGGNNPFPIRLHKKFNYKIEISY